jgi:hypothetical protein
MKIRTKKQLEGKIARLETSGEIKEVFIKEDLFEPNKAMIEVCFRGENCSGILEISKKEIEDIHKEVSQNTKRIGKVKIMKFRE